MINDIAIFYSGITIEVKHSVYKPFASIPGLIMYTFHLPVKKINIHRNYNVFEDRLSWSEVNKGETELAKKLGEAYENNCRTGDRNFINDIEITKTGITINHSFQYKDRNAAYLWN